MKKHFFCFAFVTLMVYAESSLVVAATEADILPSHPVDALLGEELTYDISFLWFDRLAIGTIHLRRGARPGTYLAVLNAQTLGLAAFITRDRVERFETLMEIDPDGLLRPLTYSSLSLKGKGGKQRKKMTTYTFDYTKRQARLQKIKDQVIQDDILLPLETTEPVFDILSAFYNLRSGVLGPLNGKLITLQTFHRKGIEQIIIAPVESGDLNGSDFFVQDSIVRKVLVPAEIFKTNGRDLLISFDATGRPQKALVKNVIGLGDVKGVLRQ